MASFFAYYAHRRLALGHRQDTLEHVAFYSALGYQDFDLDLLDQVHAALAVAGLGAGAQATRHFSAPPFGVKIDDQDRVRGVACLFRNTREAFENSSTYASYQRGGWRGRAGLYFDETVMKIAPLTAAVAGEVTAVVLGELGTNGAHASVLELGPNFNYAEAWALYAEDELFFGSHLGEQYNLRSEGAPYAPGPRLVVARVSTALPPEAQVQLRVNGQDKAGRLYNLVSNQVGSYLLDNFYVGGRPNSRETVRGGYLQAVFIATERLRDSQLALLQPLVTYYQL